MNTHFPPSRAGALAATLLAATLAGCGLNGNGVPAELGGGPPPEQRPLDVTETSIADLQLALQNRSYSAEQVMAAYLRRIATYESNYNAFTFENTRALEQAREVDRKRAAGEPLGPLAGIPIIVKESIDVTGYPSTMGWALLAPSVAGPTLMPMKNATAVQRLVDAGAIIIGKGNMPAFADDNTRAASSWAGPTYNAIDRALAPGGSSSGVATAVAGSFAAGGLAEETGGSIQSPSSAQGLVGIKPTFALVPSNGVVPLGGSTRDVLGPIATNVRDAAILLTVLAGHAPEDQKTEEARDKLPAGGYAANLDKTSLRGKRIGLYGRGWRAQDLAQETRVLYEKAVLELEARGATVVRDPFAGSGFAELALADQPYDFRGTESAAYDLNNYLKGVGYNSLTALKQRIGMSPFDAGAPLSWYVDLLPVLKQSLADPSVKPDLSGYAALKANYLRVFNRVMDAQRLDAMVFPHATDPLPKFNDGVMINETTVSALNIAGLPGVTVPAGKYSAGQGPFSLIFVGRPWSEKALINMAFDYEQASRHRIKPVLVAKP